MASILDYQMMLVAIAPDLLTAFGILIFGFIIGKLVQYLIQSRIKVLPATNSEYLLLISLYYPLETLTIVVTIYAALTFTNLVFFYQEPLTNLLFIFLTLIIADFVSKLVSNFISKIFPVRNTGYSRSPKIVDKILVTMIYLIAILIILRRFQIDITPLIAALGILGLAVSLSLQDSVANLFAGLYLVSSSPVRVGDYIEIISEKVSGYVEDINWRETRIRTLNNTLVVLPNTKISQSVVVNSSLAEKNLTVSIDCQVPTSADLDKVETIALQVATRLQLNSIGALRLFEPLLRYTNFGTDKVYFTVVLMVQEYANTFQIRHEFIKALKRELKKEGI
jgi:small-conductance mechanosensitive channel